MNKTGQLASQKKHLVDQMWKVQPPGGHGGLFFLNVVINSITVYAFIEYNVDQTTRNV